MVPRTPEMLIINNAEPHVRQFVEPLVEIVNGHPTLACRQIEYRQLDPSHPGVLMSNHRAALTPDDPAGVNPHRYDAVIMSASPRGNDIVASHLPLYHWLLEWTKPAFGICAGHQIPGVLFGAELVRGTQKEVGRHTVRILRNDPIFKGFADTFEVEQQHHDAITCPADFVVLCESDACPVQMIRHRHRPIYTAQFHAEITNPELIRNFLDLIPT